ncbi:MAG: hypothetical protein ACP5PS_02250 [Bacteroidales bacterium]
MNLRVSLRILGWIVLSTWGHRGYYGHNYVILYHLNPEYAALYKFSGNTSLNIKEPTSNIVNALGIFTGINADTLNIYVY